MEQWEHSKITELLSRIINYAPCISYLFSALTTEYCSAFEVDGATVVVEPIYIASNPRYNRYIASVRCQEMKVEWIAWCFNNKWDNAVWNCTSIAHKKKEEIS
jgi:hypothetical protein